MHYSSHGCFYLTHSVGYRQYDSFIHSLFIYLFIYLFIRRGDNRKFKCVTPCRRETVCGSINGMVDRYRTDMSEFTRLVLMTDWHVALFLELCQLLSQRAFIHRAYIQR